jgi:hypothetical protein
MDSRRFSLILMAVNLGLLGMLAYMVFTHKYGGAPTAPAAVAPLVTNTVTQIAVRKVNATNLLAALADRAGNWRMLESSNYVVYIQNLRNFECPEETIRDIIITDVAKFYARRRAELKAQAPPQHFWQTMEVLSAGSTGLQAQLHALDKEQRDLIRELLGVDLRAEMTKYWNEEEYQNFGDEYLPDEKRDQVQALQQKFDDREQEIYARSRGLLLDEDHAALRKIRQEREAELASLLTPDEMVEYQLRHSDTANTLRSQLAGFAPSEEEFRRIFQLQKSFDDNFNQAFDPIDDAAMAVKAKSQEAAQAALNEEFKKTLGPERFAQFQRAQDDDYKTLVQIGERFDLSREVADRVYSLKVMAERQRQQIESNPNLTDEQRATALLGIARETERTVAGTMGDKIYKSYQKAGGQWLSNLYVVPEPPAPVVQPEPATQFGPLPPLPAEVLRGLLLNAPPPIPPPPNGAR